MTTTSAEGLPELPEPHITDGNDRTKPELGHSCTGFNERQMMAYGRQCYGAGVKDLRAELRTASPAEGRMGEFVCTGDEIRCHDGNGCECEMRGLLPKYPADSPATLGEESAPNWIDVFNGRAPWPSILPKDLTRDQLKAIARQIIAKLDDVDAMLDDAILDMYADLFDEVYEREWDRAADAAEDRHAAIIGPADRHATREAIKAILAKKPEGRAVLRHGDALDEAINGAVSDLKMIADGKDCVVGEPITYREAKVIALGAHDALLSAWNNHHAIHDTTTPAAEQGEGVK